MKNLKKILSGCLLIICSTVSVDSSGGGVLQKVKDTTTEVAKVATDPLFLVPFATSLGLTYLADSYGVDLPPGKEAICLASCLAVRSAVLKEQNAKIKDWQIQEQRRQAQEQQRIRQRNRTHRERSRPRGGSPGR
jgi:hypothetical protein